MTQPSNELNVDVLLMCNVGKISDDVIVPAKKNSKIALSLNNNEYDMNHYANVLYNNYDNNDVELQKSIDKHRNIFTERAFPKNSIKNDSTVICRSENDLDHIINN